MKDRFDICEEVQCGFRITENRKKLWIVELDMLESLEKICKANGINYFLLFGSAIGAVRHKGFIPWDDDIDIGMLREDFEKFLRCDKSLFGEAIDILYGINEHGNGADVLLRIRDRRTTGIIANEIFVDGNKGAFIEIYPFDYVNDNLTRKCQISVALLLTGILCDRQFVEHPSVAKQIKHFLCGLFPKKILWIFYEKVCKIQNNKKSMYIDTISIPDYAKTGYHLFRREDVEETIYVDFEYTKVRIPKGYDRILNTRYGNYMELPVEEERGMHHNAMVFYDPTKSYTEYENKNIIKRYFEGKEKSLI